MNNKRRNLSLLIGLLCLLLALTCAVACADDTTGETEPADSNTETAAEGGTSAATEPETAKETESEEESMSETIVTETETGTETETETEVDTSPVRIMYYNVYGYGKLNTIPDRLKVQVELIAENAPDILCVQEFDTLHRNTSKSLLKRKGYKEVAIDGKKQVLHAGGKNCEAMFYNSDRVKLVESGGELYPEWVTIDGVKLYGNNDNTKSTTWGIFEQRSNGKLFLVVNTHFMWTDTANLTVEQANLVRVNNAERILALIERVRAMDEAYADIPVIFGGDLNCQMDKTPFSVLSEAMTPAYQVAEQYQKIGYYGCYATYDAATDEYTYREPVESDNIIDHVFVKGDVKVLCYLPITEFRALITSDHLPWYVDIRL